MLSILVIVYAPFVVVGTVLSMALVARIAARHVELLASLERDVAVAECELCASVRAAAVARHAAQVAPVAPMAPVATGYGIVEVDYATLGRIAQRLEAERNAPCVGSTPGPRALLERPVMGWTFVASSHYAEGWGVCGDIRVINRE